MPDYVDIDMRIPIDLSAGFRNPYGPGPEVSVERDRIVTLPSVDDVPVFIVLGDSTMLGLSIDDGTNGITDYSGAGVYLDNAEDGSAYGYVWNKWMTCTGAGGNTLTKSGAGVILDQTTSGTGWAPLTPRVGGTSTNGFAGFNLNFNSDVDDIKKFGPSPMWDMMVDLSGLFRDPNGDPVTPYICFFGYSGAAVGRLASLSYHPENVVAGIGLSFPLYDIVTKTYINPAIKNLLDDNKNPFLAGLVTNAGGADALSSITEGNTEANTASGLASYQAVFDGLKTHLGVTTLPTIIATPYNTNLPDDETGYRVSATSRMVSAAESFFNDGTVATFSPQGLLRDVGNAPNNRNVHFRAVSNRAYGKLLAGRYMNMLTYRKGAVIGPTLSGITY